MEGFKETHNERKLFFNYTTVLLQCKPTQCPGVIKTKIHHLQSWASGNAWSGAVAKPHTRNLPRPQGRTQKHTMDEGTRSHTLTGQCCASHGQTSTVKHSCCMRRQGSVLVFLHPHGTCWGDLEHTDIFNLKLHCTQASEDMIQKCTMNVKLNTYFKGKYFVPSSCLIIYF